MALRRTPKVPDPDHPEPVEIVLGLLPEWTVQPVFASLLGDGYRMEVISQDETGRHGGVRHHRILVHADDADAVRRELAAAELL